MHILTTAPPALLLTAALALATPAVATTPEHSSAAVRAAAAEPAITIAAKSTVVQRGKKVVITGTVTSKKVTKVSLQQKRKGTNWKTQATTAVKANGSFRLKDKTTTAVIRKYRVISATGPRTKSAKVTVGVYEWKDLTKMHPRLIRNWAVAKKVSINSVAYGPAFYATSWYPSGPEIDFNLAGRCVSLRARFGVNDTSDTGTRAGITVLSDGWAVWGKAFSLTESEVSTIPLSTPFRLTLTGWYDNGAFPVVAQPEVYCTSTK